MKSFVFSFEFHSIFVCKGPIDNKPALVQAKAWCQTGNKPLPEALLTLFNDAQMQHKGEMR